jgi:hypothetical protein
MHRRRSTASAFGRQVHGWPQRLTLTKCSAKTNAFEWVEDQSVLGGPLSQIHVPFSDTANRFKFCGAT